MTEIIKYTNRYRDTYYYEPKVDNQFLFVMTGTSMQYCRMGGLEGQEGVDHSNLGFFDPAGGPFIGLGAKLPIGTVKHIKSTEDGIIIEVE